MTAKIVEVLTIILETLHKNKSLEEVNKILNRNREIDKKTLSIAFSIVYDKVLTNRHSAKTKIKEKQKNFRLFTEEEKEILGPENHNYILHLINIGLLSARDVEQILEQIMVFPESRISKDEINWIILISLVELNSSILPGSRVSLFSTDTIN
jgi:uncharacterized protein Smg (DUF494 family)